MDQHIQNFVNWQELDKIVFGSEAFPQNVLGPHQVEGGYVIVAYHPNCTGMVLHTKEKKEKTYEMERINDGGAYAVYVPGKTYHDYTITKYFEDGSHFSAEDPYCFPSYFTDDDTYLFGLGTHYEIYEKMGAHPMELNGVYGTYFAVWAPHAQRVSVVGDFNMWDGRVYQMRRRMDAGIFELFVPHVGTGEIYKYEILTADNKLILKSDPYGNEFQKRPENASVVADLRDFKWSDQKYMEKRNKTDTYTHPMNIYEVHIGSWKRAGEKQDQFMNYRDIAHDLADYCKYMGYTHVELMGISEHPFDGSWGYQVTGYYAPTSRFGTPEDFAYFVNYMHENDIEVILDWVPAHFPKDAFALGRFDGQPLYEHPDPRRGEHPDWGTYIFNYGMKEVSNFLIGSALFWLEKFHVDGLRTDAVASMLYLDYGKQDGQWLPNKYGGNENLDAVEFLKHLNSIVAKRQPGAMVIAEESTAWPNVTARPEDNGLGFTYKWNMGWMNDFLEYISTDPLFRKGIHNKLTFAMAYHHAERYILVLSHDEVVHGKCSMIYKQPGDMHEKFQGLRTAYGFMFGHPGKKLLFMGQDFGQTREWSEERSLDWYLMDDMESDHRKLNNWVRDLLHLEDSYPALYATDYTDGFQWINPDDREKSIITWLRRSPDGRKSLIFVCNFTPVVWDEGYRVGVPNLGSYKEIMNSDDTKYGGSGEHMNGTVKAAAQQWDRFDYSIPVKVPPMSCVIFEYTHKIPKTPEQLAEEKAKRAETRKKNTAKKKAETKLKAETGTKAEKTADVKKKPESESKPAAVKAEAKTKPKAETGTKAEKSADVKKKPESESKPAAVKADTNTKAKAESGTKAGKTADVKKKPESESKPAAVKAGPKTDTRTGTSAKAEQKTKANTAGRAKTGKSAGKK